MKQNLIIRAVIIGLALCLIVPSMGIFAQDWKDPETRAGGGGNDIRNSLATQVIQSGFDGGTPVWDMGIHGEDQIVGLFDLGLDYDHEAFRNATNVPDNAPGPTHRKVREYHVVPGADNSDSGTIDHGTMNSCMMAGDNTVIIGANSGNVNGRGSAYKAKISFVDGGDSNDFIYAPADWGDAFQWTYDDGGRLFASAIGYNFNVYNDASSQTDTYLWNNKDFLTLFPVGSGGPAIGTMVAPATCKNGIAVGACYNGVNMDDMTDFSSRGPSQDNRLKPDVIVPGTGETAATGIVTASSDFDLTTFNMGYAQTTGTGQASASATGATALIRQYITEGWYPTGTKLAANGFAPSGAMMKAALINSADEMMGSNAHDNPYDGMAYPNCDQGWGRVKLDNVLYFDTDTRFLKLIDHTTGLEDGDSIIYTFNVLDNTEDLEVTLVWMDYPSPTDNPTLINNLDLTVTDVVNGFDYKGNVFAGTPGYSVVGGTYDDLNTVENVLVNPLGTEYQVKVDAALTVGPQPFALVLTGRMDPDYGIVTIDRTAYSDGDTINIRVEDLNVAASTVEVNVASTTEAAGETVTLFETGPGSGVYTGSVDTMFSHTMTDGFLQVSEGDTITVTYSDGSPVHDSIATAGVDALAPVITNVRAYDILGTAAKIGWDTDEFADATVYYGTSPDSSTWTLSATRDEFRYAHEVQLQSLSTDTTYYFDVESSDLRGMTTRDDNGGWHYRFETASSSSYNILILDDDQGNLATDGTPFNEDWTNMLDHLEWSYLYWERLTMGIPQLSDLQQAKCVLWIVADGYPTIDTGDRAVLESFLLAGGKLFIVGQDIGWDLCAGTEFIPGVTDVWFETYLKATFNGDDADGGLGNEAGDMEIQGLVGGDPISGSYLAGTDLDQAAFGPNRFYPDDITASTDPGVTINWDYDNPSGQAHAHGGNAASVRFEGTYPSGSAPAKMVYEAFAHEMLGTWNPPTVDPVRVDILNKTIIWLLGGNHPYLTLTSPVGGENFAVSPVTITWAITGANSLDLYYSNNSGCAWQPIPGGIGLPGATTSFVWDVSSLPNGQHYRVKIIATGVASIMEMDESASDFTINLPGADTQGPMTIPGSPYSSPLPVFQGSPVDIYATVDDSKRGNSNIESALPAECYIDVDPGIGNGFPMTLVDGLTSPTEVVTGTIDGATTGALAQGEHLIFVRGQDEWGNWGVVFEGRLNVITTPPSVTVTAPNAAEFIITSGTYTIQWSAIPGSNPLTPSPMTIYYSDDGGGTWQEINGGAYDQSDDGSELWNIPANDGVNYLVRVDVIDVMAMVGTDESDYVFSVDQVPNDEWFLQVEMTSGNYDLNMMPVEISQNDETTVIPGLGDLHLGTWQTTDTFTGESINGDWTFNIYGFSTGAPANGSLFAKVFNTSTPASPIDTTILDDENVGDFTTPYHLFSWTDTLAGQVADGNGLLVEIWLNQVEAFALSGTDKHDFAIDAGVDKWAWGCDDAGGFDVNVFSPGAETPFGPTDYPDIEADDAVEYIVDTNNPKAHRFRYHVTDIVNVADVTELHAYWKGSVEDPDEHRLYIWNDATNHWDVYDTSTTQDSQETMTATINANPQDYIDGSGDVHVLLYQDDGGGPARQTRTNYVYLNVTWAIASPQFTLGFDHALSQSSIQPSISAGAPVWADATGPVGTGGPGVTITYITSGSPMTASLWYTTDGGAIWNPIGLDSPADGSYAWTLPGYGTYDWAAFAVGGDDDGGAGETWPEAGPYIYAPPIYDIPLTNGLGWNLISFPLNVTGDPTVVLDDSAGDGLTLWDYIQWFDPSDPADPWKTYATYRPGSTNDLLSVDNTMGIWINIIQLGDGVLTVSGPNETSTTIFLQAGWNLVGYPSFVEDTIANNLIGTGYDRPVEGFDGAAPYRLTQLADSYVMKTGEAYWIHVPADTPWVVSNVVTISDPYSIYGFVYLYDGFSDLYNPLASTGGATVEVKWWSPSVGWDTQNTVTNPLGQYMVDITDYVDGGVVFINASFDAPYGNNGYNYTHVDVLGSPGGILQNVVCGVPYDVVIIDPVPGSPVASGVIFPATYQIVDRDGMLAQGYYMFSDGPMEWFSSDPLFSPPAPAFPFDGTMGPSPGERTEGLTLFTIGLQSIEIYEGFPGNQYLTPWGAFFIDPDNTIPGWFEDWDIITLDVV